MPEPETPLAERPWEDVERMVTVERAREQVLAAVRPLPAIDVPLLEATGMAPATDLVAGVSIPPFRNSAMDGYAVMAADTGGASTGRPVTLRVIGNAPAGRPNDATIGPGTAQRIMTGAPMPAGADAVVRFEETIGGGAAEGDVVRVTRAATAWDNVRPAGEDIAAGSVAVAAGSPLRAAEIGLLAAIGCETVPVHRRPLVAILSTGDEVRPPGEPLGPGQIRDSNSAMLAAMARGWGADVLLAGIARDDRGDLQDRLGRCRDADLIVTSGGVSLGDYDMVKDVLRSEGEIAIWQVRMKPGKPLAFGTIGGKPLLGLPGNPVAAAVSWEQFGRPAIRRMLGYRTIDPVTVEARLLERIDNRGQRRHFVRGVVEPDGAGGWTARTAGDQGAGVLTSLVRANALLVIPESIEVAEPGQVVTAQMTDWGR